MPKRSAPLTSDPQHPISLSLTVDERDAIDRAKERAKHMLTLVMATLNEDDVLIVGGLSQDADRTGAVLTACDIITEAFNAIDEAFHAADQRRDNIAATVGAGGAR